PAEPSAAVRTAVRAGVREAAGAGTVRTGVMAADGFAEDAADVGPAKGAGKRRHPSPAPRRVGDEPAAPGDAHQLGGYLPFAPFPFPLHHHPDVERASVHPGQPDFALDEVAAPLCLCAKKLVQPLQAAHRLRCLAGTETVAAFCY